MNRDSSCFPLYFLALSGKLIKLFPVNFECRIHRRNLIVFSLKAAGSHFPLFIGQIFCAMFFQNLTGSILCIRHLTEKKNRLIGFIFICQQVTKLCCFPKADRKYLLRHPDQGFRYARSFLLYDSTQLCDHIMGRIAFSLYTFSTPCIIPLRPTVKLKFQSSCQIVDDIMWCGSHGESGCPCVRRRQNSLQTTLTSIFSLDRRLTLKVPCSSSYIKIANIDTFCEFQLALRFHPDVSLFTW